MKNMASRLAPILALAFIALAGCVKTGGSSSSSPLVQGFNDGSASVTSGGTAKVIAARPEVISIAGGKAKKISAGMSVPLDAILRSNATGSAKLSLPDGATVNVSPNSEVALADFADSPEQATEESGLSDALSRVFSGRNAKKNQLASTSTSPQATIGIRGLQSDAK